MTKDSLTAKQRTAQKRQEAARRRVALRTLKQLAKDS